MESIRFGDLLAFYREQAGFTQKELADRLGIQYQQVSAYERDLTYPRKGRLIQLCEILNAPYPELAEAKFRTQNPGLPKQAFPYESKRKLPPIPLIGLAAAGKGLFPNLEGTASAADDYLDRPDDLRDEQVYGVRVFGDSMLPVVKPGSIVIASLEASCQNGDLAVVVTQDGEAMIKLVYYKGEELLLKSTNPAFPDRSLPRSQVLHLHPVVYIRMGRV
ncbi:MAG: helix-turn-helix domain-containing protein [Fidelibacterota bacterium]|nr:MAG: helix-turn-helix domain-containing protein [Candidatus Neomarinimicrobiota bacterium]